MTAARSLSAFLSKMLTARPVLWANPVPLSIGDSSLLVEAHPLDQPGIELQFKFHVTENCKWYLCSSTGPMFSTSSSIADLTFYDHFSTFSSVHSSEVSSHMAIAKMLSDINFRKESKNIWRLFLASYSRQMVPAVVAEGCFGLQIVTNIELLTSVHFRQEVAQQMVAQLDGGQLVGEPVPASNPTEVWTQLKKKLMPEIHDL